MSKSIAQTSQYASDFLSSAKEFIKRFRVGASLKTANAYKAKGIPVVTVFQYLFSVVFTHQSAYADIRSEKHSPGFKKDTVYRFLNMRCANWIRFTTLLALRIIQDVFIPAGDGDGGDASLIVDDSVFSRDRSKTVELPAKVYDHAHKIYLKGFRMLSLGWTDGISFMPVSSVLLSSENKKSRYNEAGDIDHRANWLQSKEACDGKGHRRHARTPPVSEKGGTAGEGCPF